MNPRRYPVAIAVLALLTQMPLAALAQAPAAGTAPAVTAPAKADAAAPAAGTAPADWIQYDDISVTPVVDGVSRAIADARAALAAHDHAKAADALQAAARTLQTQADQATRQDRTQAAADARDARNTQVRMAALVRQLDRTAAQVRAGKIASTADLDRTFDKAQRADLDRRWVLTDVQTWYPLTREPQRNFVAALDDYAHQDYRAAAVKVRQAAAYVRLEAGRADGDARRALERTGAELDRTAAALDRGGVETEQDLHTTFARADRTLALAHREEAAESWARKAYDRAGYELKAAAQGMENAAAWGSTDVRAAAASAASEARTVGDKLASGAHWTKDEVGRGFDAVRHGLARLEPTAHATAPAATPANPG
ncbi:hypothetical protein [Acidovorax sacchari]|uniref:hypothetical protein n=1 Tax=Acidovorax sacchari TaxID=3230736 RepID=UPI0039E4B3EC